MIATSWLDVAHEGEACWHAARGDLLSFITRAHQRIESTSVRTARPRFESTTSSPLGFDGRQCTKCGVVKRRATYASR